MKDLLRAAEADAYKDNYINLRHRARPVSFFLTKNYSFDIIKLKGDDKMSENKSIKMIGHKQLFLFSVISCSVFCLFFLIPVFLSDAPILFLIVGQVSSVHFFLIYFAIYHRAFFTVKMDESGVSVGKRKIKWEDVEFVKLKEVSIRTRRSLLLSNKKILDSYVCVFGKNGRDIRFAANAKSYHALKTFAVKKSPQIKELLDKTSV